jgi:hypothetical protein
VPAWGGAAPSPNLGSDFHCGFARSAVCPAQPDRCQRVCRASSLLKGGAEHRCAGGAPPFTVSLPGKRIVGTSGRAPALTGLAVPETCSGGEQPPAQEAGTAPAADRPRLGRGSSGQGSRSLSRSSLALRISSSRSLRGLEPGSAGQKRALEAAKKPLTFSRDTRCPTPADR